MRLGNIFTRRSANMMWHDHYPKPTREGYEITHLWDIIIPSDRHIKANGRNILIENGKQNPSHKYGNDIR